jgi:hypothetical protein
MHFTARLFVSLLIAPFGAAVTAGVEFAGMPIRLLH